MKNNSEIAKKLQTKLRRRHGLNLDFIWQGGREFKLSSESAVSVKNAAHDLKNAGMLLGGIEYLGPLTIQTINAAQAA